MPVCFSQKNKFCKKLKKIRFNIDQVLQIIDSLGGKVELVYFSVCTNYKS